MSSRIPLALFVLFAAAAEAAAQPVVIDGRACRINRTVDRMIVLTDSGARLHVVAAWSTPFEFGLEPFERADLRPGDPVSVSGWDMPLGHIEASAVRVRPNVADAIWKALLPSKSTTLVGRFSVREAQTEFFSLRLPGMNFVRVEAKAAYGGNGRRVRVSTLKSGDLLEVHGEWVRSDLFRASHIYDRTDNEPAGCRVKLSPADAAAEQAFLGG